MLRIYLVRHGQTRCGLADVLCGRCDTPLTAAGRRTARALAAAFSTRAPDALYSSPLPRALATLVPLARACRQPVTPLDEFAEIDFGAWDGRPSRELLQTDPHFAAWVQNPALLRAPGGESGSMVLQRALRGIARVRARHAAGRVLVMSHKTTLRLLLCHFTRTPERLYRQSFAQPEGAVNVVDFLPGEILLREAGDISYQRGSCNPSFAGGAE